mmetsp:Transcript_19648/g.58269  ORF Transcript_19648/g.58269 Transcript_19648/m.58269 type:complete len:249 (+) Transcript_19648:845-1591(+)
MVTPGMDARPCSIAFAGGIAAVGAPGTGPATPPARRAATACAARMCAFCCGLRAAGVAPAGAAAAPAAADVPGGPAAGAAAAAAPAMRIAAMASALIVAPATVVPAPAAVAAAAGTALEPPTGCDVPVPSTRRIPSSLSLLSAPPPPSSTSRPISLALVLRACLCCSSSDLSNLCPVPPKPVPWLFARPCLRFSLNASAIVFRSSGTALPLSFIALTRSGAYCSSSKPMNVMAVPLLPARPVRPTRCT